MFPLLAQLVAPPLQRGPVRLPGSEGTQQRPAPSPGAPPLELQPNGPAPEAPPVPAPVPGPVPPSPPQGWTPEVRGLTVLGGEALRRLLAPCSAIPDPLERLQGCQAALSARLVAEGYVNSRVYVRPAPAPGFLEVVEGRIAEVRVIGGSAWLNRRVARLLQPLRGQVLHLPGLESDLQLLRRQPGLGGVQGRLTRLGSDPTQASLALTLPADAERWQGELSVRNDGNDGSGEFRGLATLLKPSLAVGGDTLLLYGEINVSDAPTYGAGIASLSYTLPLVDNLLLTGAFGYSRRNLVELSDPFDGFSISQFQGLGQLEWVFHDTLRTRWSAFLGFSGSRSTSYLDDAPLPDVVPEIVREPRNGYLKLGVSGSGLFDRGGWGGTAYFLQGVAAATPSSQQQELSAIGIDPGSARAIGGLVSATWAFAPSWQLNARAGGQVAFEPLTSSMQFTLGSDVGLRGLPGQLISGDDGWLATGELAWTFWSKGNQALQLVPFIGAGGIRTSLPEATFSDTVGAGGILARWLQGDTWTVELGWVDQFSAKDTAAVWDNWSLGNGLYARVSFRF